MTTADAKPSLKQPLLDFLDGKTDIGAVRDVLRRGADASEKIDNVPALFLASKNIALVTLLLDAGADVNATTANGWTALMYATSKSDIEIMKLLISRGAALDVADDMGGTALMYACTNPTEDAARLLVERGACLDKTVPAGKTARDIAAVHKLTQLVTLIDAAPAKRALAKKTGPAAIPKRPKLRIPKP